MKEQSPFLWLLYLNFTIFRANSSQISCEDVKIRRAAAERGPGLFYHVRQMGSINYLDV